jgi:uncharacterized membrane protein HdeD (DUF308 family)
MTARNGPSRAARQLPRHVTRFPNTVRAGHFFFGFGPGFCAFQRKPAGIASAIYTFAGMILVSGVAAFFAARKWGRTKRSRPAIYSVVGFVGLVIGVIVMQYRLRHIGQ